MCDVVYSPSQEHVKTTSELSKSLESTRAHLQGQLRNKEAENNRLSVQIKVDSFYFLVYSGFLYMKKNLKVTVSDYFSYL